jgi:protein-disulfide isomerase
MKPVLPAAALKVPNRPVAGRDHLQGGAADAEFVLLEYGDYQCPYCGEAYALVKEVQQKLGDRLCFAFRNFPLTALHSHAEHAAEAAEAAGSMGYFWAMHDMLFENQDALEDDDIAGYATALRLDPRRLLGEVLSGVHTARVREDFRNGVRGGVNGTPTFFVNGLRYAGPPTSEGFLAALLEDRTSR